MSDFISLFYVIKYGNFEKPIFTSWNNNNKHWITGARHMEFCMDVQYNFASNILHTIMNVKIEERGKVAKL